MAKRLRIIPKSLVRKLTRSKWRRHQLRKVQRLRNRRVIRNRPRVTGQQPVKLRIIQTSPRNPRLIRKLLKVTTGLHLLLNKVQTLISQRQVKVRSRRSQRASSHHQPLVKKSQVATILGPRNSPRLVKRITTSPLQPRKYRPRKLMRVRRRHSLLLNKTLRPMRRQ